MHTYFLSAYIKSKNINILLKFCQLGNPFKLQEQQISEWLTANPLS